MSKWVALATIMLALGALQLATTSVLAASGQASSCPSSLVALYAHAPPPGGSGKGAVLNTLSQWGSQHAALLQDEVVLTLDRPLGSSFLMEGTVTINLWVRADNRLGGFFAMYLSENTADGKSTTIPGSTFSNVTVILDSVVHQENFAVLVNSTLAAGSRIQLHVRWSSTDKLTSAYLLYDSSTTPTKVTIPAQGASDAKVDLFTTSGEPLRIFEADSESKTASILARINITDSFGLYRLEVVFVKVSNSSGSILASYPNLLGMARVVNDYTATFETRLSLPEGVHVLTVAITDNSGNTCNISTGNFFVAVFYPASIRIIDSISRPIINAELVAPTPVFVFNSTTNQTGWATPQLPNSKIVGSYQLAVFWRNLTLRTDVPYYSEKNAPPLNIIITAYDLQIRVKLFWFDLPGVRVNLMNDSKTVVSGITDSSGSVNFTQVPVGRYVAEVHYFGSVSGTELNGPPGQTSFIVQVQFPQQIRNVALLVVVLVIVLGAFVVVARRRRVYESPFDYINTLAKGGLPNSCTATIAGGSGSGKTVLMESLAHQGLKAERGCVYVTNAELPSSVRSTMSALGLGDSDYETRGRMIFIDCYSALSGTSSKEKMALASFTDLTRLGILITAAIDQIGGIVDIYFDSLTPLFTNLKSDYVVSFLQTVGAKVKSYNCRLCATISTSVDQETLARVEEMSDLVIETQLIDSRKGQKRRLRIKKLRGQSHVDAWTPFKIAENQGIIFFTRKLFKDTVLRERK